MLKASLICFALALGAMASGIAGTAGISFELGRFLFVALLGIAIVTFVWAVSHQKPTSRSRSADIPP